MYVIKANGEKAKFRPNKIMRTCMRAGASGQFARHIVEGVKKRIYDGIKTRDVLKITLALLKSYPQLADKYTLKRAIMDLGPSGFAFEKYFARVLEEYGFETEVGKVYSGKNVRHEVDISAYKNGKTYMIECKYHNAPGIWSDMKVAMYTYARFLDLKKDFDRPWLVTNTKCTNHAVKYSKGVNLRITSWRYPEKGSLKDIIERKKLYPITILRKMSRKTKEKFLKSDIILANDLLKTPLHELKRKTKMSESKIKKYVEYMKGCMSDDKC